jgi:hypothetical protein
MPVAGPLDHQLGPRRNYVNVLSLSFKQGRLLEDHENEYTTGAGLFGFAQAAVLSAGWRLAGPERLPFARPGDLPQGFGGSAGVPVTAKSAAKPRRTRVGVNRRGRCGRSQGSLAAATMARASLSWA